MTPLETATTEELVDELARRYPTLIVTGLREFPGDEDADQRIIYHKGSIITGIGLVGLVSRALYRRVREVESDE